MSGIGIDLSSTTIRASYNLDNEIIALPLKEVAQSQDVGIWPIVYFGEKAEIDSEAIERLAQQPNDVITNIVHAMEIMDNRDREVRNQQLEWGSPIEYENGSFYYNMKIKRQKVNVVDVLQSIFSIIQSRFDHIANSQNKAVISVPATFGENAFHIVEDAGKVFGACTVITHDLAAIYSHTISFVDSLVICCGEYLSTVSLYSGSNLVWSLSFSDLDLPHELYLILQLNPSYSPSADTDSSTQDNRASLYCEARALALKVMTNQPFKVQDGSLFPSLHSRLDSLYGTIQQLATSKKQQFIDALKLNIARRDLSGVQRVCICGEYAPLLLPIIQDYCKKQLPCDHLEFLCDQQQIVRGSVRYCTTLEGLLIKTIAPLRSTPLSEEIWVLFKTGLHCVFPSIRKLPARKVLQVSFTERSKSVYFFKGRQHTPLAKYMLVQDRQHEAGSELSNVVLMECKLNERDEFSVLFYWKDTRERVYMIDFGTNGRLMEKIEPDEPTLYTLYCSVCSQQKRIT